MHRTMNLKFVVHNTLEIAVCSCTDGSRNFHLHRHVRIFKLAFAAAMDWLTCYKQFGTNSIIVLLSVESQTVHI
jgi:hypothetical protein